MSVVLVYRDGRLEPESPLPLQEGERVVAMLSTPPPTEASRLEAIEWFRQLIERTGGLPVHVRAHDAYE